MNRLLRMLEPAALIAVPAALLLCAWFRVEQAALLTLLVVTGTLALFLAGYERSKPPLRQIMPAVTLGALAAAGRIIFAPAADFKPVSAIAIIAGSVFGRRCGFMVGALAALVSNFFFGQGPWTPWQMYAWGMVGYTAGVLAGWGVFDIGRGDRAQTARPQTLGEASSTASVGVQQQIARSSRMQGFCAGTVLLLCYGFASALLYGFVLNSWYIVGYVNPITWPAALAAYLAGLPLDLVHAGATVLFLAVLYLPWQRKLKRVQRKFALQ